MAKTTKPTPTVPERDLANEGAHNPENMVPPESLAEIAREHSEVSEMDKGTAPVVSAPAVVMTPPVQPKDPVQEKKQIAAHEAADLEKMLAACEARMGQRGRRGSNPDAIQVTVLKGHF